jgi:hypothetical protein
MWRSRIAQDVAGAATVAIIDYDEVKKVSGKRIE